jgi:hypothetical protein
MKRITIGGESAGGWKLNKLFFSGVPTKVILTFENISPNAKIASALVLYCKSVNSDGQAKTLAIKLRNIPFTK